MNRFTGTPSRVLRTLVAVAALTGTATAMAGGGHGSAIVGAVIGAGTGALIGQSVGGHDGAVVGSLFGAVTGAAIGSTHVSQGYRGGRGGYRGGNGYYGPAPRHGRVHVAPPVVLMPPRYYAPPLPVRAVRPPAVYVPVGGYWQDGIDAWGRPVRTWIAAGSPRPPERRWHRGY